MSRPPSAHLVLVGLPGAGKTTVGRALAARLGQGFLDFDAEIERRAGMPIVRIFAERGEGHFRALERALTDEVRRREPLVVAPGGGWIENPDVVALLRPPGKLVYLRASPATVLSRMGAERSGRPLLSGENPAAAVERLYVRRRHLYEGADLLVETEMLGVEKVIDALVELVTAGRAG